MELLLKECLDLLVGQTRWRRGFDERRFSGHVGLESRIDKLGSDDERHFGVDETKSAFSGGLSGFCHSGALVEVLVAPPGQHHAFGLTLGKLASKTDAAVSHL